jgi:hypothetical protein
VERDEWVVWRQDDNGHRFRVSCHDDKTEAEAKAEEMQARGHKQLYWVEAEKARR